MDEDDCSGVKPPSPACIYTPYECIAEVDYGCGAPVYGNEGSLVQSVNRS